MVIAIKQEIKMVRLTHCIFKLHAGNIEQGKVWLFPWYDKLADKELTCVGNKK